MRRIFGLIVSLILLAALPVYAAPTDLVGTLTGAAETPPVASPGTGTALVTIDPVAHTLRVQTSFSGLVPLTAAGAPSGVSVAHIHCCGAQNVALLVATTTPSFPGFPAGPGVLSGSYDQTFDTTLASTYNPAFVTMFGGGTVAGAEAALFAGMLLSQSYLNIHSIAFPPGEIRGTLVPIPEPGTLLLLAAGIGGLGQQVWRKRRQA
jgi:hypothetical protein